MEANDFIVKIDCRDSVGLVYNISHALSRQRVNIVSLQEHVETEDEYFFARLVCHPTGEQVDMKILEREFRSHLHELLSDSDAINISFHFPRKKKLLVMATKEYHCLGELLLRTRYDTLNAEIQAVIANREGDVQHLCKSMDIMFHHIPVGEGEEREPHEQRIIEKIESYAPDFIVLARYMRILTGAFTARYPQRIVNIHHSFLPAFIGANPYRQAYNRGVKIIGATAHYVTEQLDEGPIIAQQVTPVNHSYTLRDLQRVGRDIEKLTLVDALEKLCSDRVFVHRNKTIVF